MGLILTHALLLTRPNLAGIVTVIGAAGEENASLNQTAQHIVNAMSTMSLPSVALRRIGIPLTSISSWIFVVSPPYERLTQWIRLLF